MVLVVTTLKLRDKEGEAWNVGWLSGLNPLPLYLYLHLAAPSSVFAASQAPHWNSEYLVDKWS